MNDIPRYVVGFAFDQPEIEAYGNLDVKVGLIHKLRPAWQKGIFERNWRSY